MQQAEQTAEKSGAERKRVEAVVETLATLRSDGESLAELAHDARNMVTALGLYCDLLEEPGVLAASFSHYGNELRLVAATSHRLVEKLVTLDSNEKPASASHQVNLIEPRALPAMPVAGSRVERGWDLEMSGGSVGNLAAELLASRNLLAALAGPSIALTMDAEAGAMPVQMTGEDLTRVLVNLVKNAAEAMPGGGRIQICLREQLASEGVAEYLALTIEDNGPGIPVTVLDKVFESGYTTHAQGDMGDGGWPVTHRGLGLSITRSIVEEAGGRVLATNRTQGGACFEIDLPVRTR
jgi:signal transduction histidine kinase